MQNGTKNPPDPDPLDPLPNPATPQPHQHTQSGMPRTGAIVSLQKGLYLPPPAYNNLK